MDKKLESFKEAAYLDYFRAFSVGTMATIRRLESEFKEQMSDNYFFDPNMMFRRVKTLLSTYEIMILEINDSFQFIEIPEFGQCILKIFLQMMSIIRWLLKSMSLRPASRELEVRKINQRNTISMPKREEQIDQRQFFRVRQKAQFLLEDMRSELFKMQEETKQAEVSKNLTLNKEKFLKISPSDSQSLIQQAVNSLISNSEYLHQFVDIRQSCMKENQCQSGLEMFTRIKDLFEDATTIRLKQTKARLHQLFDIHLRQQQKIKKQAMVSTEVQVKILQKSSLEQNLLKKATDSLRSIEKELRLQKDQNEILKRILDEKAKIYEQQIAILKTQMTIGAIPLKSNQNGKQIQRPLISRRNNKDISLIEIQQSCFQNSSETQKSQKLIKYGSRTGARKLKTIEQKLNKLQSSSALLALDPQTITVNYQPASCLNNETTKDQEIDEPHCRSPKIQPKLKAKHLRVQKSNSFFGRSDDSLKENAFRSFLGDKFEQLGTQTMHDQMHTTGEQRPTKITEPKFVLQSNNISILVPACILLRTNNNRLVSITKTLKHVTNKALNNFQNAQNSSQLQLHHENISSFYQTGDASQQKFKQQSCGDQFRRSLMYELEGSTFRNVNHNPIKNFIDLKKSKNFIEMRQQGRSFLIQQVRNLRFDQGDVNNLFFTIQNCRNYELVNLSNNQLLHTTTLSSFKKSKTRLTSSQSNLIRLGVQKNKLDMDVEAFSTIIKIVLKTTDLIKKTHKETFVQFRNFIRYPYSLLTHGRTKKWLELEKSESEIDSPQLCKKLGRIFRIHVNCPKSQTGFGQICEHIFKFYQKLGIFIPN